MFNFSVINFSVYLNRHVFVMLFGMSMSILMCKMFYLAGEMSYVVGRISTMGN